MWSLIILFTLITALDPCTLKGAETLPVINRCCGGSTGGAVALFEAPPWRGVSGAAPPKLKTDVKFPCKSIVISSQSGPFIGG